MKIINGLRSSPKYVVPVPPFAVSQCVSRVLIGRSAVPEVKGEVEGIADSGGTVSKIVKHATQQIEKSVVRATAKLNPIAKHGRPQII